MTPKYSSTTPSLYAQQRNSGGFSFNNDDSFKKLCNEIQIRSKILEKPLRIKINAWISKINSEVGTPDKTVECQPVDIQTNQPP